MVDQPLPPGDPATPVPAEGAVPPVATPPVNLVPGAAALPGATPAPDPTTAPPQDTPPGILDKAVAVASDVGKFVTSPSEISKAAIKGTRDAADETIQDGAGLLNATHRTPGYVEGAPYDPNLDTSSIPDLVNPDHLPDVASPETGTGKFAASTVQFVEGLAALGKVMGPLNVASKVVRAGDMALRSGADFALFFDPYQERLSNIVQSYPSLANPVADFLKADPSDGQVVARLKNGLENAGLGVALDGFVQGIVGVSHYMRGNTDAAIDAVKAIPATPKVPEAPPEAPKPGPPTDTSAPPEATPGAPDGSYSGLPGTTPRPVGEAATLRPKVQAENNFTQEQISDTADALLAAHAARNDPANLLPASVSPINLDYITNPKARSALLTELGNKLGEIKSGEGGVPPLNDDGTPGVFPENSHAARLVMGKELAQQMGMSPTDAQQWAAQAVSDVNNGVNYVPALKIITDGLEARIRQHAQWAQEGRIGPYADEQEFNDNVDKLTQAFMEFGQSSKDLGSAFGRGLNAHQITTGQDTAAADAIAAAQMGGRPDPDAARTLMLQRIAAAPPGIDTTVQIVKPMMAGAQKLASYYINSLLGYTTVAVKGTSDLIKGGIIQPTEQAYKGIYRGLTSGDWTQFTQAGGQVMGMVHSIFDSLEFGGRSAYAWAKDAAVSGQQYLDKAGNGLMPTENAGGDIGIGHNGGPSLLDALDQGDYTYATTKAIGVTLGMPTRLINTLHEFSQQVIYRGRVYGKANTEATLQGLQGYQRDQFVENTMRDAFGPNGEATDQEALQYARAGTYSSLLPQDSLGGHVQDYLTDHPLGRAILPFVKAPTNLLYDVYSYTPVAKPVIDGMRSVIQGGGPSAEAQVAKLLTGATMWTGALALAYNGHLTGGGSQDPQAKAEQMETGWRPHSLVLADRSGTKHYYPVDRIDPFGSILSMAADFHEISTSLNPTDLKRLGTQMVVSVTHDALSKNYLKNFSDLLSTLGESSTDREADQKWGRLVQGMAGGLVPTQLARSNEDPLMRDTKSVMDAMKNRVPGLSATIDRKFNTLGEPVLKTPALGPELVSPFYHSVDQQDDTQQILSNIANTNPTGFKPPPRTMRLDNSLNSPGVDLSQVPSSNGHSSYDRFQQLIGDRGDGSPTFRDELTGTFQANPQFWSNPAPDGNRDYQGQRFMALNELLNGRREAAKATLISENPALKALLIKDKQDAMSVLRQGGSAPVLPVPGQRQRP